jgi:2-polyprenyl-3-methyl-5-hydroxy-6-metoxy-1,4-benzoquinol methylase
MQIHEDGYWIGLDSPHGTDEKLAKGLADFFIRMRANSVIDLGCGNGYYTKYLNARGIPCIGVDGNPNTTDYDETLFVANLTDEQDFGIHDWVLSLEVGEHIPEKYMNTFLMNIHKHNQVGVVLSWSTPELGGDGHVNPKTNTQIKEIFKHMGYKNYIPEEIELRTCCAEYPKPCWWFSKTLMVFLKVNNGLYII